MAKQIVIEFDGSDLHRIRNCGEDLWRAFNDRKFASITLADVDARPCHLVIEVHRARQVRRVAADVRKIVEWHRLVASISTE